MELEEEMEREEGNKNSVLVRYRDKDQAAVFRHRY